MATAQDAWICPKALIDRPHPVAGGDLRAVGGHGFLTGFPVSVGKRRPAPRGRVGVVRAVRGHNQCSICGQHVHQRIHNRGRVSDDIAAQGLHGCMHQYRLSGAQTQLGQIMDKFLCRDE